MEEIQTFVTQNPELSAELVDGEFYSALIHIIFGSIAITCVCLIVRSFIHWVRFEHRRSEEGVLMAVSGAVFTLSVFLLTLGICNIEANIGRVAYPEFYAIKSLSK